MNNFVYDIPTKVYFGEGQLCHLGEELMKFGNRVLLTYGGGSIKRTGLYDKIVAEIEKAGLELFELSGIEPNPRIDTVRRGAAMCKDNAIDVVLAVGGGSTLDASKFIAAGAVTDTDPWEFLDKRIYVTEALPLVTVLTIAATGSEMDDCGVISNPETDEKLGGHGSAITPKVSFMDPTLTYTVSPFQTACGCADMLSHILEIYFTMEEDMYMLDCFMEGLMKTIIKYAPVAIAHPDDYEARANLMWTSSWAINGFADGGKQHAWSCHPIEHQLSAMYDMTHGLGLAIITPKWMRYCLDHSTVKKYVQYGVNVFGIDPYLPKMEIAKKAIEYTESFLYRTLGLTDNLADAGVKAEDIPAMAEKTCRNGVIKGFKTLTPDDVEEIYRLSMR